MTGLAQRPPRAGLATALACALLVGCGADDPPAKPKNVTIATDRETGRNARAVAEGIADDPSAVAIRTSAAPKQRVEVTWGLSCPKTDTGADKGTGGTYTTTPPDVRPLELPKRAIAFCGVRAQARLTGSGRVRVTLLASER